MIAIEQLRYVRLAVKDMAGAVDFGRRILGLQLTEQTESGAYFRTDFRDPSLVYCSAEPAESAIGFEIYGHAQFESAVAELSRSRIALRRGNDTECLARKVRGFASFRDPAGVLIELVSRPLNSGWRSFPSRDSGITGLSAVALRTRNAVACEAFWTGLFNAKVSDWVGDAAFIRFDAAHHRLAYYPSMRNGILAVEFGVENVDLLMQNSYFVQSAQVKIVHGPGRRPTSGQMFLTIEGPEGALFSFVSESDPTSDMMNHKPRQFPREPLSFCAWGSRSELAEFSCPADRGE